MAWKVRWLFQLSGDAPEPEVGVMLMFEKNGAMVPHFVKAISMNGLKAFVRLEDVNMFEGAEQLKAVLSILKNPSAPNSKRGDFYDDELIGFAVYDASAGKLGVVNQVENQGLEQAIGCRRENVLIPCKWAVYSIHL